MLMNEMSKFLADNYVWFIVLDVLLLFALIGYFVDSKNKKKKADETEVLETIKIDDVDNLKNKIGDKGNDSLSSALNKTETLKTVSGNEEVETLTTEEDKPTFQG